MATTANVPAVVLDRVTVRRGETTVLRDLSLTLDERRIGIVGRNGSGKSTLVRLFNGLIAPDSGEVRVFGRSTRDDPRRLPGEVGFIFQNPDHQILFPTVEEELAFGLTRGGRATPEVRAAARRFLERHGVGELADAPVHELSEGRKHLVCILAVLIAAPRILVLDEPFASLDLPTRNALTARIAALEQRVVMISHEVAALKGFDRVLWLEDGRIAADGAPAEVLSAFLAAMTTAGAAL